MKELTIDTLTEALGLLFTSKNVVFQNREMAEAREYLVMEFNNLKNIIYDENLLISIFLFDFHSKEESRLVDGTVSIVSRLRRIDFASVLTTL